VNASSTTPFSLSQTDIFKKRGQLGTTSPERKKAKPCFKLANDIYEWLFYLLNIEIGQSHIGDAKMFLSAALRVLLLATALPKYIIPAYATDTENPTIIASIVSITDTLNLFARSVDTHDYTLLDSVFSPDATANFATSAGFVIGLPAIKTELQTKLTGTVSQHALSTHMIDVVGTQNTMASASTYLQGTFFGQGNLTGQIRTTYGR